MPPVEIGSGPEDLYNACIDLLTAANEACATTVGGVFARAYVANSLPSPDKDQLTVHVGSVALGNTLPLQPPLQPGVREGANRALRLVAFTITTYRCITVAGNVGPKLPSPQTMSHDSLVVSSDLWAIWNHLARKKREGTLFPPAKDRVMSFEPAVPLQTQGGLAGWAIQVGVEMPGFPESY